MTAATDAHAIGAERGLPVEIVGASHAYPVGAETLPVIDDVTLRVAPGEHVALLGPSGCGKSTLLRLVAGLELPTAGRVLAGGRPVEGPDPERALVFQDPTLFPWRTVWQNVAIGPQALGRLDADRGRIDAAIELVGLGEFRDALPQHLSGGMAQRAALARALVNDPPVLLMDEPLGRLDALTRLAMQRELLRLWEARGFTALLVTHDVDEALVLADRVVVLSPRPARVVEEIEVAIPRPRPHDHPRFLQLRHRLLELLGFEDPSERAV